MENVKTWFYRVWICLWLIAPVIAICVEKLRGRYHPPEQIETDTRLFDIMYPPKEYLPERQGKSRSADPQSLSMEFSSR